MINFKDRVELSGFVDFLTQLAILYSKHNHCPFHEAMDCDVEDITDYFLFIIEEENKKKQKKLLDTFEEM